jgi:hypothetical protein
MSRRSSLSLLAAVALTVAACSNADGPIQLPEPADCSCISPAAVTMAFGETVQLAVTAVQGERWTWTSSDSLIVSVTQTGKIQAVGSGFATISAASNLGHRASVPVTVSSPFPSLVIMDIDDVAKSAAANLSAVTASIDVRFEVSGTSLSRTDTLSLIVTRPNAADTTIATTAGTFPSGFVGVLRWNTAARNGSGSLVFPNGAYAVRVTSSPTPPLSSTKIQLTLANQ